MTEQPKDRTPMQFCAFSLDGAWRLEETPEYCFHWIKEENFTDSRAYRRWHRIWRLRPDRDLYQAKYRLFRVMRNRYGIEPV